MDKQEMIEAMLNADLIDEQEAMELAECGDAEVERTYNRVFVGWTRNCLG